MTVEENSLNDISEHKQSNKYRYDVIKKDKTKTEDIVNFVPITNQIKKDKQKTKTPKLPQEASTFRQVKHKVGLLGSRPSRGFRSSSSLQGYHASTSPDNFLKK